MTTHTCHAGTACICYGSGLQPSDDCPIRGGPDPRRCVECGRYFGAAVQDAPPPRPDFASRARVVRLTLEAYGADVDEYRTRLRQAAEWLEEAARLAAPAVADAPPPSTAPREAPSQRGLCKAHNWYDPILESPCPRCAPQEDAPLPSLDAVADGLETFNVGFRRVPAAYVEAIRRHAAALAEKDAEIAELRGRSIRRKAKLIAARQALNRLVSGEVSHSVAVENWARDTLAALRDDEGSTHADD